MIYENLCQGGIKKALGFLELKQVRSSLVELRGGCCGERWVIVMGYDIPPHLGYLASQGYALSIVGVTTIGGLSLFGLQSAERTRRLNRWHVTSLCMLGFLILIAGLLANTFAGDATKILSGRLAECESQGFFRFRDCRQICYSLTEGLSVFAINVGIVSCWFFSLVFIFGISKQLMPSDFVRNKAALSGCRRHLKALNIGPIVFLGSQSRANNTRKTCSFFTPFSLKVHRVEYDTVLDKVVRLHERNVGGRGRVGYILEIIKIVVFCIVWFGLIPVAILLIWLLYLLFTLFVVAMLPTFWQWVDHIGCLKYFFAYGY